MVGIAAVFAFESAAVGYVGRVDARCPENKVCVNDVIVPATRSQADFLYQHAPAANKGSDSVQNQLAGFYSLTRP